MVVKTNLDFVAWSSVRGSEMITALLDRLTHHCHIVETGNEGYRITHVTANTKRRIQAREQERKGPRRHLQTSSGQTHEGTRRCGLHPSRLLRAIGWALKSRAIREEYARVLRSRHPRCRHPSPVKVQPAWVKIQSAPTTSAPTASSESDK